MSILVLVQLASVSILGLGGIGSIVAGSLLALKAPIVPARRMNMMTPGAGVIVAFLGSASVGVAGLLAAHFWGSPLIP